MDETLEKLSLYFDGAKIDIGTLISIRKYSEIFHAVASTTTPTELAIKFCLVPDTNAPDINASEQQFSGLQRTFRALKEKNPFHSVPIPIMIIPEQGVYAMSWVNGRSLTEKLPSLTVFSEGNRWFSNVGAWLGTFHAAGPSRNQIAVLDSRMVELERIRADPVGDPLFLDTLALLEKKVQKIQGIDATTSWLHGDCKTDNFIINGDITCGIDICLKHENPVEYDLAQFLNNLALILRNPLHTPLLLLGQRLEQAFLNGYESSGQKISPEYLVWLRLSLLASFWHSTLKNHRGTMRAWILNRMFRGAVSDICTRLSQLI
jgi:tRNA A-37 threonylcarbamoyl transferase component Bud32